MNTPPSKSSTQDFISGNALSSGVDVARARLAQVSSTLTLDIPGANALPVPQGYAINHGDLDAATECQKPQRLALEVAADAALRNPVRLKELPENQSYGGGDIQGAGDKLMQQAQVLVGGQVLGKSAAVQAQLREPYPFIGGGPGFSPAWNVLRELQEEANGHLDVDQGQPGC